MSVGLSEAPKPLRVFAVALLVLPVLLAGSTTWAQSRSAKVSLAVFSDIYEMAEAGGRGGFARIAAAVAAERALNPNVIVAHAGDTLSPSLMSGLDQGRHIIELTNLIAPDVFVPGNHEFDFGEAVFRERMKEARFPLYAANLREPSGVPLAGFQHSRIIEIDGVMVGLLGLTDDESARRSNPGSLKLLPTVATAKDQASALKLQGADIVVAVVHASWQDDLRLAGLGLIDVVLSGHDHNLWVGYDGRSVIAESQSDGANLVVVDLDVRIEVSGERRKVSWKPKFRIVDTADVTPDAEVARRVAGYQAVLDKDLDVEIGATSVPLDSRKASVRNAETALGNFIADAFRAVTGADVAIVNGGSIRGDRQYEAGAKLTKKDIYKELPFSDKVVVVEVSGADLREALENAVWFAGKGEGRFAQVSGVRMKGRLDAVPGKKLDEVAVAGRAIDPSRTYKVAVTTYLASGKDGYTALARGNRVTTEDQGRMAVEIVMDAVIKAGTIAPAVEDRVVLN